MHIVQNEIFLQNVHFLLDLLSHICDIIHCTQYTVSCMFYEQSRQLKGRNMITLSITSLRDGISNIASKVMYSGERFCIERSGKPACAVISVDDLQLLEALEDKLDIEAAKAAIRRNDYVDWEVAKKELGL